jgi:transcriptional regulator with XRE-family HTH domain
MFGVTDTTERIAAEVRAEVARQKKNGRWVSGVIGIDEGSASLRLRGKRPFRVEELAKLAEALDVPASKFLDAERVA